MSIGIGELMVVGTALLVPLVAVAAFWVWIGGRAARGGYATRREYLRSTPQTDAQKDDAVEMALRGLVLCILGLFFRPLVLVGILPLYFGGRKVLRAWFGFEQEEL
jgi:hypothetical protein